MNVGVECVMEHNGHVMTEDILRGAWLNEQMARQECRPMNGPLLSRVPQMCDLEEEARREYR